MLPPRRLLTLATTASAALAIVACTGPAAATQPEAAPAATAPAAAPASRDADALPTLAGLVAQVSPAVVAIDINTVGFDFFLRPVEQRGAGSGAIVRPDGYIVTNAHVIQNATSIHVALADGRVFAADVVGSDAQRDLALLKIEADGLPWLPFAEEGSMKVGEWVVALGNALGLEGGPTVTVGIISATGRTIRTSRNTLLSNMIQTDAAINEGNSGGPLVNLKGQIVGLNTTIFADAQGIGFSINAGTVQRFTDDLIAFGRVRRPLMGLSSRTLQPGMARQLKLPVSAGVLVVAVSDGPAKRAGIKPGDVILRVAGKPVASHDQFIAELWTHRPGESVEVVVARGDAELSYAVTLDERPG